MNVEILKMLLLRWRAQAQALREKARMIPVVTRGQKAYVSDLLVRADTLDACFNELWNEGRQLLESECPSFYDELVVACSDPNSVTT